MNEKILNRGKITIYKENIFYPKTNSLAIWKKYIIPDYKFLARDYKSHVLGKNEVLV
jgi:hypothetical protein